MRLTLMTPVPDVNWSAWPGFADVGYGPADRSLYFYLLDYPQNQFTAFSTDATHGNAGLTAEWIVEQPPFNGILPKFGQVTMTGLWFVNGQGNWDAANASDIIGWQNDR